MQIYRRDDLHVVLPPLSPAVGDLGFEEFEYVEAKHRVRNTEDAAEDLAGFILDEEEDAMSLAAGDFLEDPEEVDRGLELAEGEGRYWGLGNGGEGVAKLIHGGRGWMVVGRAVLVDGRGRRRVVELFRGGYGL
jgi:hypothetical protein